MEDETFTCAICAATIPTVEQAEAAGWEPSFYPDDDGVDTGRPLCLECIRGKCELITGEYGDEDYVTLKPEFRHLWQEPAPMGAGRALYVTITTTN